VRLHPLERLAADEVVIEADETAVVELVRREVVVLDVLGVETAAERRRRLVRVLRQPLAIGPELLAGIDRGQRARQPAGLERIRVVGPAADLDEAVLASGLEQRRV